MHVVGAQALAAAAHALNGDQGQAFWLSPARRRSPGLDRGAFLQAFPFKRPGARIFEALDRLGV